MNIEIWSDFACPFCYIGKKRFENALARFPHKNDVKVVYKAYQLNPNAPKVMVGTAYESFAKGHGTTVEQAKQRFDMFTQNAKTVGLTYDYNIIQMTNTFDAHRLAKWASTFGKEEILTERFMKAYFSEGKNLADHGTLLSLVSEVLAETKDVKDVLSSNQYAEEVKSQIAESRQIGVQGVPFFVVNRKYGISGAQSEDYFYGALEQIWAEQNKENVFGDGEGGSACTDEGCN